MFDAKQELAALQSEQQKIAQNYQEAKNVAANCERRLLELQGAINFAQKAIGDETSETTES
tara:strand:+ start:295 stop:477 length:183 start_codon:yes stop_codon:yes gene_type:complete